MFQVILFGMEKLAMRRLDSLRVKFLFCSCCMYCQYMVSFCSAVCTIQIFLTCRVLFWLDLKVQFVMTSWLVFERPSVVCYQCQTFRLFSALHLSATPSIVTFQNEFWLWSFERLSKIWLGSYSFIFDF